MHQELRDDDPREERVRELSERLSEVASTVAMLTVAPHGGTSPSERRAPPEPVSAEQPEQRQAEQPEERPTHLSPVSGNDSPSRPTSPREPAAPAAAAPGPSAPSAPSANDPLARMRLV